MRGWRRLGRPRATELSSLVNAICDIAATGCQWRQLPRDFPPHLHGTGLLLPLDSRWAPGDHQSCAGDGIAREGGSQAAPDRRCDRQPIREDDGERRTACLRRGKEGQGHSRRIVTDTAGHPVGLIVHTAGIQDRDGMVAVSAAIRCWGCRRQTARCSLGAGPPDGADHQTPGHRPGIRGLAPTLGCRTHLCLARAVPQARQGLRSNDRKPHCLDVDRPRPPACASAHKSLITNAAFRVIDLPSQVRNYAYRHQLLFCGDDNC